MEITIGDIKALIASDESRTLELKKATGDLKDGMHLKDCFTPIGCYIDIGVDYGN